MLRIADGLSLPVEAATETFAIWGKRGSGKSSTATTLAEQFIRSKVQVVVLDPVDVWWGLKAGADGTREGGLPVYVFGGEHADLPLEHTAGRLMADTIIDHGINAILVVRSFSNREKAQFVSDFADQMFRRNRKVVHLFVEEAHEFIPQNPYKGEEEMQGRMTKLIREGRTSGIGMTIVSQRPASISTNARTQVEVLVAHRILGKHDRVAIDGWIEHHDLQEERQKVLASLATLKTGESWFWAPDFPEDKPIGLRRVLVNLPTTFDSRRTPKVGEKRVEPKSLVPVDLEQLGEKMAATRERAKQSDPVALRAEVARLRRELTLKSDTHKSDIPAVKRIEVPVLKDAQIKRLEKALIRADDLAEKFLTHRESLFTVAQDIKAALSAASSTVEGSRAAERGRAHPASPGDGAAVRAATPAASLNRPRSMPAANLSREQTPRRTAHDRSGEPRATSSLPTPQQRILDVLAGLEAVGMVRNGTTLGAWMGRHPRNKGLTNALGALRTGGFVEGFELTDAGHGFARAIEFDLEHVRSGLAGRQRDILDLLAEAYPGKMTRESLVEKLGLEHIRNKGFTNALGALHSRGLIHYQSPGWVVASDILFPQAIAS